ncbi:MAG: glycosyl hydrolase family 79 C-terminal domain-containing protein, partial [Solirubrobacteraceae bacterium]
CNHGRVLRRRAWLAVAAALAVALLAPFAARADLIQATVGASPHGQTMGDGFVGVSFEYRALHQYTGRNPLAIDPVLLALVQGLAPGQSPVVRIGGDSTDGSWWPIPGMIPQGGLYYPITQGWLRTTAAFADDLNAKLILGINLAAGRPAIAAAEGRTLVGAIGRRHIDALEIGNEPDLYGVFPWFQDTRGHIYHARAHGYDLSDYTQQFAQWAHVLPHVPLAGPALSGPAWMPKLSRFVSHAPRLALVTYHRYPLRACVTNPLDPGYPSIPNLLADRSAAGLAAPLAQYVNVAHRHALQFRVDELNSASCQGAKGVSDTFASALWALDTLFNLAAVGVDGVNVHMLPGSAYELFTVSQTSTGAWQAFVHPEYYGLAMFAQAFPPGAQLLPVSWVGATDDPVKVWATLGADGTERITLINKDPLAEHDVQVQALDQTAVGQLETLQAPSVSATSGVTLGGQTFGDETQTGVLGAPQTTPVVPAGSVYTVPLPPASAALLTIAPPSGSGSAPLARHRAR